MMMTQMIQPIANRKTPQTMKARFFFLVIAALSLLLFAANSAVANDYAEAKKIGKAHGPGCEKGSFLDIEGKCWHCPEGYKHDNILLKPSDPRVCKKKGYRKDIHGKRMKSCLESGGFGPGTDGNCYKCPHGYHHDASKLANHKGVCYKEYKDKYSAAEKSDNNLFCERGQFFDPIDGGTCWECPNGHPSRTTQSVKSNKACARTKCGGDGERPCLVTERIPSCNKGLVEDFFQNKCIAPALACESIVDLMHKGEKKIETAMDAITSEMQKELGKLDSRLASDTNRKKALHMLEEQVLAQTDKIAILNEIARTLTDPKATEKLKQLFSKQNICHGKTSALDTLVSKLGLAQRVIKLVKRTGSVPAGHKVFFGLSFSVDLSAVFNGGVTVVLFTDFQGNGGSMFKFALGGSTGIGAADISFAVKLYPNTSIQEFAEANPKKFGFNFNGGVGTAFAHVGTGLGFEVDHEFSKLDSVGVPVSLGVHAIPNPLTAAVGADVSASIDVEFATPIWIEDSK